MPPKKPTIFNERGEEALGTVGPYMIGDSVVLKCIAVGGELTERVRAARNLAAAVWIKAVDKLSQEHP